MSENKVSAKADVCQWCEKQKSHLYKDLVCDDCYQRLIKAGLKEEEIFKNIKPKSTDENSPDYLPRKDFAPCI